MVVAKVTKRCYCRDGAHGREFEYEQSLNKWPWELIFPSRDLCPHLAAISDPQTKEVTEVLISFKVFTIQKSKGQSWRLMEASGFYFAQSFP